MGPNKDGKAGGSTGSTSGKSSSAGGKGKQTTASSSGSSQTALLSQLAKSVKELAVEVKSIKSAQMNPPAGPASGCFGGDYFSPEYGYDYDGEPNYPADEYDSMDYSSRADPEVVSGEPKQTDEAEISVSDDREDGEIVDKYDKFLEEFMTPKEETGGEVHGRLAVGVNKMFSKGMDTEVFKKKINQTTEKHY